MPSIGLDFKRGCGWGAKSGPIYSLSLGWICFWCITAGTVTDVLEQSRVALGDAARALHVEISKQNRAAQILQSDGSQSDGVG